MIQADSTTRHPQFHKSQVIQMAEAILIAGPNGAGKTTAARSMLSMFHPGVSFLNADEIQRTEPNLNHTVTAGRAMLQRLEELETRKKSFALETTLSSAMYAGRMRLWRNSGYRIFLHFIELPSADHAVRRVAARVAAGGHSIPEADIRRRFDRGIAHFHRVYEPIVDVWYHWKSDEGGVRLVERHENEDSR